MKSQPARKKMQRIKLSKAHYPPAEPRSIDIQEDLKLTHGSRWLIAGLSK
ncbi:Hypothetical protein Minf_0271 [Methylacidiphilum infernorum V4]|uniref:Uncharacterized protein n=1 Tax=Methylacidiphilum infernorum (isolate V4) TaxID=481448 RepID=B3DY54_METI4|nr:Hypothetical protein Minf_0271 [Methylacidiphilum infernorum V4]